MNKRLLDQFSPFLFMGVMLLLVVTAVYYVMNMLTPAPPDLRSEDASAIAKYKEWIQSNDLPFVGGKIKPADLPSVYRKVIEYDVKAGDLKSARIFISEAIQKKVDTQVLALIQLPEAKELIGHMQNAHRKVEALRQIVEAIQKKTGEADLARLVAEFCRLPFNPSACPDQAEAIGSMYRSTLVPLKDKDAVINKLTGEIEKNCLPPTK